MGLILHVGFSISLILKYSNIEEMVNATPCGLASKHSSRLPTFSLISLKSQLKVTTLGTKRTFKSCKTFNNIF